MNVFFQYGLKAGGVSYVWDEWSAYSSVSSGTTVTVGDPVEGAQEIQVQTRTRTGYTYSQLQTRTRTCSCTSQSGTHTRLIYGQQLSGSYQCFLRTYTSCSTGQITWQDCVGSCTPVSCGTGNSVTCEWTTEYYDYCDEYEAALYYDPGCFTASYSCRVGYYDLLRRECVNTTTTSCNWGSYTGWSNTGSCSATSPSCTNGAVQRQCQTVTLCAWNAYSAWTDTASCTAATPACANGALERNCQQRTRNAIEG